MTMQIESNTLRRALMAAPLLVVAMVSSSRVLAQFRVEVSGSGASQIPVGIAAFRGEEAAPQKISQIMQNDWARSGALKGIALAAGDETTRLDARLLKSQGVDYAVYGSVNRLADGRFDVRARLWDVLKNAEVGAQAMLVAPSELRLAAHRLSDWVHERTTGERGVASTRIAYITKTGGNAAGSGSPRYNLWVADSDGDGAVSALTSAEPLISPAWSPSAQQLAYVSFESRKPVVYVHDVATGQRRVVANFKGSNSAPAWSPDGRQLAVTLSVGGGSQMYLIAANGQGEPKRLSTSNSIDTEAAFAPDGKSLYFVSDRGGSPQIYRMSAEGGAASRVTFAGGYNISPAISLDGSKLAFISRVNGVFKLMLQDLATNVVTPLTDTTADESPSFSPNGRQVIYATQVVANGKGQEALMTTTLDGRTKAKLTAASGDIREPDWSGYLGSALK